MTTKIRFHALKKMYKLNQLTRCEQNHYGNKNCGCGKQYQMRVLVGILLYSK